MHAHQRSTSRLSPFHLLLAALPCVFQAACTDDNSSETPGAAVDETPPAPPNGNAPAATEGEGTGTATNDSGSPPASACAGNPLGGAAEGDTVVDFALLREIAQGPFPDGLAWTDEGGGALIYSEVNAQAIVRNSAGGGVRSMVRWTGDGTSLPIGNAIAGGFIFTAMSTTAGAGAILRTSLAGGDEQTFPVANVNSPNGIVASKKGFVYFTDPAFQASVPNPTTGVYRVGFDGTGLVQVQQFVGGGPTSPGARADGIALSPVCPAIPRTSRRCRATSRPASPSTARATSGSRRTPRTAAPPARWR
jgi:hypothetical protein